MNGKKARAIRKAVYGDRSIRARNHFHRTGSGTIFSDEVRQAYQKAKRMVR